MSAETSPCSRRRFLLGTAATAAGALIAACAPKSAVEKVAAKDIPVGGGVVVGGYVVTQPEKGKFAAFSNVCPHQNGRITEVRDGVMICPNHGSEFDIATGKVIAGPSRQPAGEAPLSANGTELIVGQK
ncbi:Rieske (2Fe-2S) protein [Corynebacterium lactis]|uniref:Iron-sulfur protein n=1 Tax=Corynebacterium lactis RW2-5 TaxID=1408189 RepID=A0A0K2GY74_9CORY|nr:Rieske (2Fe-2S) protein [Corynebacterium lactis]ALA66416.1 iron-sulfur protein [Corynebacterium lactis RW2-5]